MEALNISSFDKEMCRILKGDWFPAYNKEVQEREDNGAFFIEAENDEGRKLKLKFRRERILTDICIVMYDDFYGDYLTSLRVA